VNLLENAKRKTKEALADVNKLLSNQAPLDHYMKNQLKKCQSILSEMLDSMENGTLPPIEKRDNGMGHMIVDSWDSNSELGNSIIEAERAYLKV